MNIGFIGYRNSGKSTIARKVQKSTGRKVINSDKMIRDFFRLDIPEIIEKYGWNMFRFVEGLVLDDCRNMDNVIFDLGGGTILNEKAIEGIRENTIMIYLECSPGSLIDRARANYYRPALTGLSLEEEINHVLTKRKPVYEKFADIVINTDDLGAKECTRAIIGIMQDSSLLLNKKEKIFSGEGILCASII